MTQHDLPPDFPGRSYQFYGQRSSSRHPSAADSPSCQLTSTGNAIRSHREFSQIASRPALPTVDRDFATLSRKQKYPWSHHLRPAGTFPRRLSCPSLAPETLHESETGWFVVNDSENADLTSGDGQS